MLRLIQIEFLKVKSTKYFWIFTGLFIAFLLSLPVFSKTFLDYIAGQGADLMGMTINKLPFYDFVDIWQNMTFLYKFVTLLSGFVVVISVANEYRYGTVKQNVIDGLSRKEFILSKLLFIVVLSAVISFFVFLIGLWMGYQWSAVTDAKFIFKNISFVGAYFLILVGFQVFSLMLTLIIKKSGITILFLLFYFYAIEAFAFGWISYEWKLEEWTSILPLRGMANIVSNPFPKYFLQEVETTVSLWDTLITLSHIGLYTFLSFFVFTKRDIR